MLFAILTLTLAAQAPQQPQPTAEQLEAARVWLRGEFLKAAEQVNEFKQKTRERFDLDPSRPQSGLEMTIAEHAPDASGHPVRHTMVSGIIAGSAADKAGIKPGDRIAAIGTEELDYESGKAVLLYLSNYEDTVPLTIQTAGVSRKIELKRVRLPCLQTVYNRFPEAKWLGIWNQSQTMLRDEAKLLENPKTTLKQLEKSNLGYAAMMQLWVASFEGINRALALEPTCTVLR